MSTLNTSDYTFSIIMKHAVEAMFWADSDEETGHMPYHTDEEARIHVSKMVSSAHLDTRIKALIDELTDKELAQFGHDLYLTIGGHGVGFWDGDWDTTWSQESIEYICEWCDKQPDPFT